VERCRLPLATWTRPICRLRRLRFSRLSNVRTCGSPRSQKEGCVARGRTCCNGRPSFRQQFECRWLRLHANLNLPSGGCTGCTTTPDAGLRLVPRVASACKEERVLDPSLAFEVAPIKPAVTRLCQWFGSGAVAQPHNPSQWIRGMVSDVPGRVVLRTTGTYFTFKPYPQGVSFCFSRRHGPRLTDAGQTECHLEFRRRQWFVRPDIERRDLGNWSRLQCSSSCH
jgi:hypothetical protein